MKSLTVILTSVLLLALAGAGVLVWQQQRELDVLKAEAAAAVTATARWTEERDALEKRVREARDETMALQAQIAALHKEPAGAPETPASASEKAAAKKPGGAPADASQASPDNLKQWLADADDPAVLRRLNLQARNAVLRHYGDLFKQLNLTPEQADQFAKLLTDKRQATMDVAVTGYQHGEDPSADMDHYREQVIAARTGIEDQIGALLGDANYAQYQDFDHSVGQMNVLNNLQLALRSTSEPLTTDQTTRFKDVLQESNANRITSKVINDSREFLSPAQLQALQDLRAVQQANSQKRNQPIQLLPTAPGVTAPKPEP